MRTSAASLSQKSSTRGTAIAVFEEDGMNRRPARRVGLFHVRRRPTNWTGVDLLRVIRRVLRLGVPKAKRGRVSVRFINYYEGTRIAVGFERQYFVIYPQHRVSPTAVGELVASAGNFGTVLGGHPNPATDGHLKTGHHG